MATAGREDEREDARGAEPAAAPRAAVVSRGGRTLFLITLVAGIAFDLWSKHAVFAAVARAGDEIEVIEGFCYLTRVENPGAMWSLFQGLPSWFWVAVRSSVFLALLAYYLRYVRGPWWIHLGFGLVLAGACGNVYDNLFTAGGRVRDFLHLVFWGWAFPTFNVADSMITVGAALLLLYFYRHDRGREAKPA